MSEELQKTADAENNNTQTAELLPFKLPAIVKKLLIITAALFIFQIPLFFINEIGTERERKYKQVQNEISAAWGKISPLIPVPYRGVLLPEDYRVSAELVPEVRYRGIYQTVVYRADIQMDMIFRQKEKQERKVVLAKESAQNIVVTVNGKEVPTFKETTGYHFFIPETEKGAVKCHIKFSLSGAESIQFVAYGSLKVKGAWSAPGFSGVVLPDKRHIENKFFSAEWSFSQHLYRERVETKFHLPTSDYASVLRFLRYATLFLVIFFGAFLAAEHFCKIYVHEIQYLVSALTPILFYLMLLAFSEKCGFLISYIISSVIVIALTVFYARMIFNRLKPALLLGGVFSLAYALNYFILRMEEMALFAGTCVLIILLAFTMVLTGKLNRR
ncbi:MAG: inner membrane CreD family protein [Lentisphaeria bacterium]|nr:inner membrane CreD family protein [Lentisphaeria bacterium]